MKDSVKKLIIILAVIAAVFLFFFIKSLQKVESFQDKYAGCDLSSDVEGANREGTYTNYLKEHEDASYPQNSVSVDLLSYIDGTDVTKSSEQDGALYTGDESEVTWNVVIPETGFYYINVDYLTVESRGVEVEREIYINGELPFSDAALISFKRLWTDAGNATIDNQGNEIRPQQVERYEWQNAYCKDEMGYVQDPYLFYFEKGENTLTFTAVNEPMILGSVTIEGVTNPLTYDEYIAGSPAAENSSNYYNIIQGEESTLRSESSLYAKYDRSSATTQPYSVTNTILNYTGGDVWAKAGQWIEWEFDVPEDGYYNISIKGRQNYARGSVSCRNLTIDGEIPFEEVSTIEFGYSSDWQVMTLSDDNGDAYRFYMTAGTHTIRLEAALGEMGSILEKLEDSTYRLNQIYRRVLIYTGATPDQYRDYNIDQIYPEIIDAMDLEAKRLYKIIDDVVTYTGQKADKIATAQTIARQLEIFVNKPYKISVQFVSFKDNITALGTAILNMSETKLDIDYIVISADGKKVDKDSANFFQKAWHEVKSFFASFVVDYDSVGNVYEEGAETVTVWIVTGRDQGTILKSMVDDTFTPEYGININVEIVDVTALLNAVVAGRGPDVVLSVGADQPVNYALRNAAEDLSQFDDCEDVLSSYYESAYTAYQYDGGIYAIPETQNYDVLFYRTDILEEIGVEVPETWDDLIALLPTIQGNNLEVGLPVVTNTTLPDLSCYYSLLYQLGGDVYNESGMATTVDEEAGVSAFTTYTSFYNDYGLPTLYDFVSRFRSGQMPIAMASYTLYNTLIVSAPEIKGLWDFTLIPGTIRTDEDGNEYIDKSVYSTGTCTMMIKQDNEITKQNAWTFMKWWAQSDTQVRFGHELEALLGSSARYATANREAFEQLAWSASDIEVLEEQWSWTVGFREVAGGYYTGRHIVNAIRKVLNDKDDPRETILDYAITINEELVKKRKEFGLPVE